MRRLKDYFCKFVAHGDLAALKPSRTHVVLMWFSWTFQDNEKNLTRKIPKASPAEARKSGCPTLHSNCSIPNCSIHPNLCTQHIKEHIKFAKQLATQEAASRA